MSVSRGGGASSGERFFLGFFGQSALSLQLFTEVGQNHICEACSLLPHVRLCAEADSIL